MESINEITLGDEKIILFDVLNENWSVYEMEDNSILKTKFVLISMIDTGIRNEKGAKKIEFESQILVNLRSPKQMRRIPEKVFTVEELETNIETTNLKFRRIKDGGNSKYKIGNRTLEVLHRPIQIDKTFKNDQRGNPAYIVRSETELIGIEEQPKAENGAPQTMS